MSGLGNAIDWRGPEVERFWAKVIMPSAESCWEWKGAGSKRRYPYGSFLPANSRIPVGAHVWVYKHTFGSVPDGCEVHHKCRNKSCVNPFHLEAIAHAEHMAIEERTLRTTCKKGHALTEGNIRISSNGARQCLICARAYDAHWHRNKRREMSTQGISPLPSVGGDFGAVTGRSQLFYEQRRPITNLHAWLAGWS